MEEIINKLDQIEKSAAWQPPEVLVEVNKLYNDLEDKLDVIINDIDVIFEEVKK